ncbi:MAG: NAD(P)/FAD-dependent oxidoreductase [Clostridia bacterium]
MDVTVVGGGPVGLYGLYSAGLHGLSARLFERLPVLGGQLEALYPEKVIYDVAGYPAIAAHDLVEALKRQGLQFGADLHLGCEVLGFDAGPDGVIAVKTAEGSYPTRSVVLAAGIGRMEPRHLGVAEVDALEGHGVHYFVGSLRPFHDRDVLIVGGGNSAADWALNLAGKARSLTLIHRRDAFQCHKDSAAKLHGGPYTLKMNRTLVGVREEGGHVSGARLHDVATGQDEWLSVQEIIVAIGLIPNLGPLYKSELTLAGSEVVVDPAGRTNVPWIYAAGDIVSYPAKIKLIATGFGEVATAIYDISRHLIPRPAH